METTSSPPGARIAVVRAIPNPPHKRRWCGLERWVPDPERRPQQEMVELPEGGLRPVFDEHGKPIWAKHGLPWPDHEIKVFVVDQPALFDPEKNGGVPQEISPTTLVMLEADPRIAVKVIGDGGNDVADELVHAKALIAELEEKLKSAQRDLADTAERESAKRVASANLAEEQGKQIAALANELAQARAQLSAGHRKGR